MKLSEVIKIGAAMTRQIVRLTFDSEGETVTAACIVANSRITQKIGTAMDHRR